MQWEMELVKCEMQSISSRIWTHVVGSISFDDNHYTIGTAIFFLFISVVVLSSLYTTQVTINHFLRRVYDCKYSSLIQIIHPVIFLQVFLILIIFEHIYLTHTWDPDRYYHSGTNWTNKGVSHTRILQN